MANKENTSILKGLYKLRTSFLSFHMTLHLHERQKGTSAKYRPMNVEHRTSNFELRIRHAVVLILKNLASHKAQMTRIWFVERRSEAITLFDVGRSMFNVRRSNNHLPIECLAGPVRTFSGRSGLARGLINYNYR